MVAVTGAGAATSKLGKLMSRKRFLLAGLALIITATGMFAQRRKDNEPAVRSVEGMVRDQAETALEGAVVQLKDTKSLQIRSFITKPDGSYQFQGLNPNIDYELKADYKGLTSDVKTLSVFDSRPKAVIHLKVNKK